MFVGYQYDIMVASSTYDQHNTDLWTVVWLLLDKGLWLCADKCVFSAEEIVYLGNCITAEEIKLLGDKVDVIKQAKTSQDVTIVIIPCIFYATITWTYQKDTE